MAFSGIDVSEWQSYIDWSKVNKDFAMLRSSYGSSTEDDYFRANAKGCIRYGIGLGAYHFVYATDVDEAITNADFFIRTLSLYKGKVNYPVACDFEYDSMRYMRKYGVEPTRSRVVEIVRAFCKRVEEAGYYVMVYTNYDLYNTYFFELSDEFDIWYARWDNDPTDDYNIVQYSDEGSVPGIDGNVDLDMAFPDFPKLFREKGLNHIGEDESDEDSTIHLTAKPGDHIEIDIEE